MSNTNLNENAPVFTIITVCYQAREFIELTIESVLKQSYKDFEYIIVDGKSTDGTCEIIEKYLGDIRIKYISEPDKGLYDAMNKGIRNSHGRYLNFMNAGDCFADEKVLEDVNEAVCKYGSYDFIYGDIIYTYPDGHEKARLYPQYCSTALYQLMGDCINHQALFAKKENFINNEFDLSYRVDGYRDWITHQHRLRKKFKSINRIVCKYSLDERGYSVRNDEILWQELDIIIKKYYPLGYPLYKFVNMIRNGKTTSKVLHKLYECFFIR